ncbi:rhodanese-like domain-containing protein [Microcoleus sp. B7-D4]|uniref:rhodanese-like domain-containing protein n=1 Tax=Microcoleus sp. B7-D4 TaxID=2818696 RepID=UPI002FCFC126
MAIKTLNNIFPMKTIPDQISNIKEKLPDITPTPPGLKAQASSHDLKARLDWGEPGLTIIDARDFESFTKSHITGAVMMPMDELVERAQSSLEPIRDIYIYGENDQQTAEAANLLRTAGFQKVAELKGGIPAWKAIDGPMDGSGEHDTPGPDAYNVFSRLQHHAEAQKVNK